ncbi:MAG: insulinase family protein [Deltaproteobacteria bacterium]|nr:insulinase family protein [Deltaproteobacteria bacterium]
MRAMGVFVAALAFVPSLRPTVAWGKEETENTKRFTLANGMTVLLEERHDLPLVYAGVVMKGGIAREPQGKEGLASFTARLMARGTKALSRNQIEEKFEEIGSSFAAQATMEALWLGGSVIARNVDAFLGLVASLVTTPTFPAAELEKLRREVLSEIDLRREDDQSSARLFFKRFLYGKHRLGRDDAGTRAAVKSFSRDDVAGFYSSSISAGNMIIAIAGDVTRADIEKKLSSAFGSLVGEAATTSGDAVAPQEVEGRRVLLVDRPGRTQTQMMVGQIAVPVTHPDYVPLTVANAAFGSGFTSRLMREVRVKRGWAYGARSMLVESRERGPFGIWTFPKNSDAMPTLDLVLKMYDEFSKNGITDEELEFAKGRLVGAHPFTMETAQKRVELVVRAELLGLPADFFLAYPQKVKAVTAKQVRDAVTRNLQAKNIAIVIVCTASHFKDKVAAVAGAKDVQIINYTDDLAP